MKPLKTLVCGAMLAVAFFVVAGCGDVGTADPPNNAKIVPPAGMEMSEDIDILPEE